MEVRAQALQLPFTSVGHYPGTRTAPVINDAVKRRLEEAVGANMTRWTNYHGSFQVCLSMLVGGKVLRMFVCRSHTQATFLGSISMRVC
jgi:hypothetical protein